MMTYRQQIYERLKGSDELGVETQAMFQNRLERSRAAGKDKTQEHWAHYAKGAVLSYEPRQGPVWRGPDWVMVWDFEQELQQLCEKFGVELCMSPEGYGLEDGPVTFYLKKNSPNPHAEIVIDDRIRDAIRYETPDDRDPEGYSE